MAPVVVLEVLIGGVATFLISIVLLLLAVVLIRFERSWASWLLLIGAIAAFVAISGHTGWVFAAQRGWLRRSSFDTLTPVMGTLLTSIELMTFCVPAAILWYCAKAVRWSLTNR